MQKLSHVDRTADHYSVSLLSYWENLKDEKLVNIRFLLNLPECSSFASSYISYP